MPQISHVPLTDEQQEIVDLLGQGGLPNVLLFDFVLNGEFNEIKAWVAVHHYGQLVGEFATLNKFETAPRILNDGRLATLTARHDAPSEHRWTISSGGASTLATFTHSETNMLRGSTPITQPIYITDGEIIVLHAQKFTTGNSLRSIGDLRRYLENPHYFANYTYTHLIKARFSR